VNDAQRAIVVLKPDAGAINETMTLVDGTKQTIPTSGNRLLKVVRNMSSASGGTGGRSVRQVEVDVLDSMTPDWHDPASTGDSAHGSQVKHYVYEENDPRSFYVYPGISGAAYLEVVYSGNPTTVVLGGDISIPDIWANAITNYVMYMAYKKDSEHAGNRQRSADEFQVFQASVTGKELIDSAEAPTVLPKGTPTAVR
jgi:hypothetical protein